MGQNPFMLRRKYLISKQFQLKYTAMIVIFMFLIAWLAGYTVYHTLFNLMGEKLANVYPQGRLMAIFKTVNLALLIRVLLLLPFVVVISILLSHRVAGPIYKMEKYLTEVAQGDFSALIQLRRRDEFKALAEVINVMTKNLRTYAREKKEIVDNLSATLDKLRSAIDKPSIDKNEIAALAKEASKSIDGLKEKLAKYRV